MAKRYCGIPNERLSFNLLSEPAQIESAVYATTAKLLIAGIRATVDRTPDKLGAKIRLARNDRVTYFGVIGGQEVTDESVALQTQNGDKVGTFPVDDVIARMLEEIAEKKLPVQAAAAG